MRFRRILRFTMKILRNEDFVKINPGRIFADSRFVGKISRNEDFANSAETLNAQVQCDLQATKTGLTIRRPSA